MLTVISPLAAVISCSNDPYPSGLAGEPIYFGSFSEPPLQLDPAESYWSHEGQVIDQIYEPPVTYHYLKRPYEVIPLTAESLPEPVYFDLKGRKIKKPDPPAEKVGRVEYTIRIKKGIMYQNHPCFARTEDGSFRYHDLTDDDVRGFNQISDFPFSDTRELEAKDYVLQIKRMADPRVVCPIYATLARYIEGYEELHSDLEKVVNEERAQRQAKAGAGYNQERDERERPIKIDYSAFNCPGIQLVDKYTYRISLKRKYPPFIFWLCMHFFGPVPREALDFYEQKAAIDKQFVLNRCPVGTGPYFLQTYKPNEVMILEKNPNYHDDFYPTAGDTEDAERGLLADAEKQIPIIERQILRFEKESIPRWNKFLQGYYDASGIDDNVFDKVIQTNPDTGVGLSSVMTDHGIKLVKYVDTSLFYMAFNMMDDIVGGYSEKQCKLRQAISIAADYNDYIDIFQNGRGILAQGPIPPEIFGYRNGEEGTNPFTDEWDPVRERHKRKSIEEAKKLMTEAGYPDGIGPNGRPLTIYLDHAGANDPDFPVRFRWWRSRFAMLGINLEERGTDNSQFKIKRRKGTWQILISGWLADYPDPENFMFLFYGPNGKVKTGGVNAFNYENDEFDELFKKMETMMNSEKRQEIIDRMINILRHDAPAAWLCHSESYSLYHSWIHNIKPHSMLSNTMKYKRLEPEKRASLQPQWNKPVMWPVILLIVLFLGAIIPTAILHHRREKGAAL